MNFLHHLDLLIRWERGLRLREAIYDAVKTDSHVLDAGCGSGLLSLWAAQAGAKHVTGVDTCDLGLARQLAKENNFNHKITFIQSDLLSDELAKTIGKFDVILGMLYYNDPRRDENQSQLTSQIHKRFLSDSGVRIPTRVEYTGDACDWAMQDIKNIHRNLKNNIEEIESRYGLSLDTLYNKATHQPCPNWFPHRLASGELKRDSARFLSEETDYTVIDYNNGNNGYPEAITFSMTSPGVFTTVIWAQKIYYEDLLVFYNESVSWINNSIRVNEGEQVRVLTGNNWRKINILTVEQESAS